MSIAAQLASQAALAVDLQAQLSTAMGITFGLPPAYTSLFASGFATAVSPELTTSLYTGLQQVATTALMGGIALFITFLALAGSVVLLIRNSRGLRPMILVIACMANTVTLFVMYGVLMGANIDTSSFIYGITFLVQLTLGGLIQSILWQAVPLWREQWRIIYRTFATVLTCTYIGVTYWVIVTTFSHCGADCEIHPKWVSVTLFIIYVVFYMIPFLYSLRRHLRAARGAGLSQESKVSRLEFRSYVFAVPSMIFCLMYPLWATYISSGSLASIQADLWLALLCLTEVVKDTYLLTVSIGAQIASSTRPRSASASAAKASHMTALKEDRHAPQQNSTRKEALLRSYDQSMKSAARLPYTPRLS